MSTTQKLSVLLGLRDRVEKTYSNGVEDMFNKFKTKQGLFRGVRNTYTPEPGYADEPTKRGFVKVSSTVTEQLNWFKDHSKDYLNVVLSIEATNAANIANAELVVEGKSWGTYSTLELLRLKSILDGKLKGMISEIPTRKEDILWSKTTDPIYDKRDVYETNLEQGYAKTTLKETVIVLDPHIKDAPNRPPVTQEKSSQINIGQYTSQQFSGEITLADRADIYVRYESLYKSVISALETANNVNSIESILGDKVLDYIFDGK